MVAVAELSLPPQVRGEVRGAVTVGMPCVRWSAEARRGKRVQARVQWWGDASQGHLFWPADASGGDGAEVVSAPSARNTIQFPVRCGPKPLALYFTNMKFLLIDICAESSQELLGRCRINLTRLRPGADRIHGFFPIHAPSTGKQVGELLFSLTVGPPPAGAAPMSVASATAPQPPQPQPQPQPPLPEPVRSASPVREKPAASSEPLAALLGRTKQLREAMSAAVAEYESVQESSGGDGERPEIVADIVARMGSATSEQLETALLDDVFFGEDPKMSLGSRPGALDEYQELGKETADEDAAAATEAEVHHHEPLNDEPVDPEPVDHEPLDRTPHRRTRVVPTSTPTTRVVLDAATRKRVAQVSGMRIKVREVHLQSDFCDEVDPEERHFFLEVRVPRPNGTTDTIALSDAGSHEQRVLFEHECSLGFEAGFDAAVDQWIQESLTARLSMAHKSDGVRQELVGSAIFPLASALVNAQFCSSVELDIVGAGPGPRIVAQLLVEVALVAPQVPGLVGRGDDGGIHAQLLIGDTRKVPGRTGLPGMRNLYVAWKVHGARQYSRTGVVWGSNNPIFGHQARWPVDLADPAVLEHLRAGVLVLEVWDKLGADQEDLLGLVKIPLGPLYRAFCKPAAAEFSLQSPIPAQACSGHMPIRNPFAVTADEERRGTVHVVLAIGSVSQLEGRREEQAAVENQDEDEQDRGKEEDEDAAAAAAAATTTTTRTTTTTTTTPTSVTQAETPPEDEAAPVGEVKAEEELAGPRRTRIYVSIRRVAGLQTAAVALATHNEFLNAPSQFGVNPYVVYSLHPDVWEPQSTACKARTFCPRFDHNSTSEGVLDDALQHHLASGEAVFEVWHRTPRNPLTAMVGQEWNALAFSSEERVPDFLLGTTSIALAALTPHADGVVGWHNLYDESGSKVVGAIEIAFRMEADGVGAPHPPVPRWAPGARTGSLTVLVEEIVDLPQAHVPPVHSLCTEFALPRKSSASRSRTVPVGAARRVSLQHAAAARVPLDDELAQRLWKERLEVRLLGNDGGLYLGSAFVDTSALVGAGDGMRFAGGLYSVVDPDGDLIFPARVRVRVLLEEVEDEPEDELEGDQAKVADEPAKMAVAQEEVVVVAAAAAEEEEERRSFQIAIEGALHLPRVRSSPPSTLVRYDWFGQRSLGTWETSVFSSACSPTWLHRRTIKVPWDAGAIQAIRSRKLELKVWHQAADGQEELVGTARVDLSPLLAGLPEVNGWYHVVNSLGDKCGQIKVAVVGPPIDAPLAVGPTAELSFLGDTSEGDQSLLLHLKRNLRELDEIKTRLEKGPARSEAYGHLTGTPVKYEASGFQTGAPSPKHVSSPFEATIHSTPRAPASEPVAHGGHRLVAHAPRPVPASEPRAHAPAAVMVEEPAAVPRVASPEMVLVEEPAAVPEAPAAARDASMERVPHTRPESPLAGDEADGERTVVVEEPPVVPSIVPVAELVSPMSSSAGGVDVASQELPDLDATLESGASPIRYLDPEIAAIPSPLDGDGVILSPLGSSSGRPPLT